MSYNSQFTRLFVLLTFAQASLCLTNYQQCIDCFRSKGYYAYFCDKEEPECLTRYSSLAAFIPEHTELYESADFEELRQSEGRATSQGQCSRND